MIRVSAVSTAYSPKRAQEKPLNGSVVV